MVRSMQWWRFITRSRPDMAIIDAAALDAARGKPGLEATVERFRFFNEVLGVARTRGGDRDLHGPRGRRGPLVAEAYEQDHRGLDAAFDAFNNAVSARYVWNMQMRDAAFKFHLDLHLAKEDVYVYRIIQERVSIPDQGKAVGVMAGTVPQDRFPELVAWMYPLLGDDDRVEITRGSGSR